MAAVREVRAYAELVEFYVNAPVLTGTHHLPAASIKE